MDFTLPELGEGVQEGELIKWLVKEGDSVAADQPVLEVMTDKATVEVPSTTAGIIKNIKAKEGDMLQVGQVLAVIEGGAAAPSVSTPAKTSAPPPPAKSKAVEATPETTAVTASVKNDVVMSNMAYVGAQEALAPSSVPAAPVVRAMAQKAGVNLDQVPATGPAVGGRNRVLESDLLRFLESGQSSVTTPIASAAPVAAVKATAAKPAAAVSTFVPRQVQVGETVERRPLRGLRRVISEAMTKSKFTIPHYSYVDEFECSQLVELREQAKVYAEKQGIKFTYLPFIIKAVVGALKEFPEVNSSLEDTPNGKELVIKNYFHIGFAVATENGLVVPVIKHADQKSLLEIAAEMQELSARTRAGKAKPEELRGSTFSITSMGNIGGLFATPIINYPEAGIMGVYKVRDVPVVKNGQVVPGKMMNVSLSLDHRVVDGAVGGYFCNAILERLSNPARLMLEMM